METLTDFMLPPEAKGALIALAVALCAWVMVRFTA